MRRKGNENTDWRRLLGPLGKFCAIEGKKSSFFESNFNFEIFLTIF
jgi:hypothetical protein